METILVISDEPALAQALVDELPDCRIVPARTIEAAVKELSESTLIVVEEGSAENIALLAVNIPYLIITRPVRLRELLYTIRERLQEQTPAMREEIPLEGGHIFSLRERVFIPQDGAARIALTEKEGELFSILLASGEEIVNKEQLLMDVWGYGEDIDTHTLETHIYRLRGKLRQLDADFDIISSEEGGYSLKMG